MHLRVLVFKLQKQITSDVNTCVCDGRSDVVIFINASWQLARYRMPCDIQTVYIV